jgi:hypothetical protein
MRIGIVLFRNVWDKQYSKNKKKDALSGENILFLKLLGAFYILKSATFTLG